MENIRIILKTSRGAIEATIFASEVPITAANFLNLAQTKEVFIGLLIGTDDVILDQIHIAVVHS